MRITGAPQVWSLDHASKPPLGLDTVGSRNTLADTWIKVHACMGGYTGRDPYSYREVDLTLLRSQ
eukprot:1147712-Pelagomonas_calceolata.AAC.3